MRKIVFMLATVISFTTALSAGSFSATKTECMIVEELHFNPNFRGFDLK